MGRELLVPYARDLTPETFGYAEAGWTVGGLVRHLWQRFKVQVSPATLRRVLPKAGFVWGRPKLTLPKGQDPEAAAKLAHLAEISADAAATIVAEDECEMALLPILRAMWHRRGEQPHIPTPGKNQKRPVFGAVNLRTGAWHYCLRVTKRSTDFIALLALLWLAYPSGLIYVLVDNASLHTSKAVQQWLAAHARVQLVYLPSYAGHELNPIEKVWWYLKPKVSANRGFRLLADLDACIRRHCDALTPAKLLALINSPVTRQAQAALAA